MSRFKNSRELEGAVNALQKELSLYWEKQGIEEMLHRLRDINIEMERADFWDKPEEAKEISQKKGALEKILEPWQKLQVELREFPELIDLSQKEYDNEEQVVASLEGDFKKLEESYSDLLISSAFLGPDDGADAILSINSGAGGTESQDWAEILLRMYLRWCENCDFKVIILDMQNGETAGVKSVSLLVKGELAHGRLKSENGIHRLVRLSPFDSNKRRHTSFASVHIMPEIDDNIEVELDDKDMRVDTFRASGAGGQHVNKTDSAIRITHIPTKIVVQCQNERSQHKNKATALKLLRSRLHEIEKEKKEDDIKTRSGSKKTVSWGSQIRSYVMHPYKMVKDLRTGYESSNVEAILDGELKEIVDSYLKELVKYKQS